jgi:hypothetical protein
MSTGEQNTSGLWPFSIKGTIDLNKALQQLGEAALLLGKLIAGLRPSQPDLASLVEDVKSGVDAVQQLEQMYVDCALRFMDPHTRADQTLWDEAVKKAQQYLYGWNIRPQLDGAVGNLRKWQKRPETAGIQDLRDDLGRVAEGLEHYQQLIGSTGPTPSDQRLVPLVIKAANEGRQAAGQSVAQMAQAALDHHDYQPLVDIVEAAGRVYTDLKKV